MFVEQQMVDSNQKLIIYHENLKRLQRYLEVLQQIHLTPTTYLNAVVEVVRRREFSQAYLLVSWYLFELGITRCVISLMFSKSLK